MRKYIFVLLLFFNLNSQSKEEKILLKALEIGNFDILKLMLKNNEFNINLIDGDENTILVSVLKNPQFKDKLYEAINFILTLNPNLKAYDELLDTPLFIILKSLNLSNKNKLELTKYIIDKNIDIEYQNIYKQNILMLSILTKNKEIFNYIASLLNNDNIMEYRDIFNRDIFFYAVESNDIEMVKHIFLNYKFKEIKDSYNNNTLQYSKELKVKDEIVKFISKYMKDDNPYKFIKKSKSSNLPISYNQFIDKDSEMQDEEIINETEKNEVYSSLNLSANIEENGKWLNVDTSGNTLKELGLFEYISPFINNIAIVKKDGFYGFYDYDKGLITDIIYNYADQYSSNLAIIASGGFYSILNKKGKNIISFKYDYIDTFYNGVSPALKDKKWYLLDNKGKEIIKLIYDKVTNLKDGYMLVKKGDFMGIVDHRLIELIPLVYQDLLPFSEGLAAAKYKDKYGFINNNNKFVIKNTYDFAFSFSEGLALIKDKGRYFFIDTDNNKMTDKLSYQYIGDFKEGLAKVKKNNKWGFINKSGLISIPVVYDDVSDFENGIAMVKREKKYFFIKQDNTKVINKTFKNASMFK